ncbi:MAG: peroxidase family protein [Gaiellaceae bacterium]
MAGLFSRAFSGTMEAVDRKVGWHRLPTPVGLLALLGIRNRLRAENLHDTGVPDPTDGEAPFDERYRSARTLDGTYNDLERPMMGAINTRFGRNVPVEHTHPEEPPRLLEPNPRTVSRELLTRKEFIPATTLNILAAAWIQFEVHDWVFHGHNEDADPWELECGQDDNWHSKPMKIMRTRHDPAANPNGGPATWVNTQTHWWDASQVYGPDLETANRIRSGELGKIELDEQGLIPQHHEPPDPDYAGRPGTVWLGYSALHTLFMREHNAVCDHLHERYPELSDDDLYDKARLVVAALIAKIHTIEWTPAIIAHPTTVHAMHANWWGLAGERVDRRFGRKTKNEVLQGLVGAHTQHHGVPYALTEEFVSVYRMHPLIPDEFVFRSARDGSVLQERSFRDLQVPKIRERLDELSWTDVFYSLANAHPGALTLHNYPEVLQAFHRPDGEVIDLAATDILRVRERGVPRYQRFREFFHLRPITSFEELCDQPEWVEELRRVYNDDLDAVDLMIGSFAEPKPRGFGFSDTAFRVFVLMASRRLEADRFFTVDYRPEVYTPAGFEWIDDNTMKSVLLRHFPELEAALQGVENAFAPWNGGTA